MKMLTEFDQSPIANMTAALDYVCKKIPTEKDSAHLRKQIADEITAVTLFAAMRATYLQQTH